MNEIDWERVKQEYENGATLFQLYEKYGITPSLIGWRLKKMGVKMRRRGQRAKVKVEHVVEYLTTPITQEELTRRIGVTSVSFRLACNRLLKDALRVIMERKLRISPKKKTSQLVERAKKMLERMENESKQVPVVA